MPTADHRDALRAWLTLAYAPGLSAGSASRVLGDDPCPQRLLAAGDAHWQRAGLGEATRAFLARPDETALSRGLQWLEGGDGRRLVGIGEADYPSLLRDIPSPPAWLFVQGEPAHLWRAQIAVVGSRRPTAQGADNANAFVRHFAGTGLTITSGLAVGVDACAHRAALDAGAITVAVAATGLDRVYPARHRELAHAIAAQGALVSELAPGTDVRKRHFPARNRIISGLALGTLVVEADPSSGSLITARHAAGQGREVFAIPGSIHNPVARGCHRLIREGATLVETAADVVHELAPLARKLGADLQGRLAGSSGPESGSGSDPGRFETGPGASTSELDDDYRQVLDALGYDPTPVDTVVRRTGLTADAVSSMLLLMELKGLITATPGGLYCRTSEVNG